jgi:hypothetical protein
MRTLIFALVLVATTTQAQTDPTGLLSETTKASLVSDAPGAYQLGKYIWPDEVLHKYLPWFFDSLHWDEYRVRTMLIGHSLYEGRCDPSSQHINDSNPRLSAFGRFQNTQVMLDEYYRLTGLPAEITAKDMLGDPANETYATKIMPLVLINYFSTRNKRNTEESICRAWYRPYGSSEDTDAYWAGASYAIQCVEALDQIPGFVAFVNPRFPAK